MVQRKMKEARRSVSERNALALANVGLIYHSMKHRRRLVQFLGGRHEAFQIAFLGLLRAAEIYDETKGVTFGTYAIPAIHNAWGTAQVKRPIIELPFSAGVTPKKVTALILTSRSDGQQSDPDAITFPRRTLRTGASGAQDRGYYREERYYDEYEHLHRGLQCLPPADRQLLVEYYFEDKEWHEMPSAKGLTKSVTFLKIAKARTRLKIQLIQEKQGM